MMETTHLDRREHWNAYLNARRGTYDFRCNRYDAVIDVMLTFGYRPDDLVLDVGAGRAEFGKRLLERAGGRCYIPVDGSTGTELETWEPEPSYSVYAGLAYGLITRPVDWFVCIEVLEHLHDPYRVMKVMEENASKGVVVTTPNPETVDVLALDPTHVTPIPRSAFEFSMWDVEERSFFCKEKDSLLAWRVRGTEL